MKLKKPDKKSFQYLGIVVIVAILVGVGSFYSLSQMPKIEEKLAEKKPTGKTMKEIIKELTTPRGESKPLPEEIINDLTSSEKGEKQTPLPEEIINNLTTPK